MDPDVTDLVWFQLLEPFLESRKRRKPLPSWLSASQLDLDSWWCHSHNYRRESTLLKSRADFKYKSRTEKQTKEIDGENIHCDSFAVPKGNNKSVQRHQHKNTRRTQRTTHWGINTQIIWKTGRQHPPETLKSNICLLPTLLFFLISLLTLLNRLALSFRNVCSICSLLWQEHFCSETRVHDDNRSWNHRLFTLVIQKSATKSAQRNLWC